MKELMKKIIFSIIINLSAFILLWINAGNIDVAGQFVFMLIPVLGSIIGIGILTRLSKTDDRNLLSALIPAGINLLYMIGEFLVIDAYGITNLQEFTKQYSSEYVTVSQNNSPIVSIILFSLLSYLGHYYVIKLAGKKRREAQNC